MTNLELKNALKALEARVAELEKSAKESPVIAVPVVIDKQKRLCPHCNAAPAYHFHVKNCKANKNKNNGDDGRRSSSGS